MHWQSKSVMRERDRRIAVMPMHENAKRGTIRRAALAFVLFGFGWIVFTIFVALASTPRP